MKICIFYDNEFKKCVSTSYSDVHAALKGTFVPLDAYLFVQREGVHDAFRWYRGDYTPVLDNDVPGELKALLLLINP